MNQARSEEEEKTEARRLIDRKAAQQNKDTSEELKQGLTIYIYIYIYIYIVNDPYPIHFKHKGFDIITSNLMP